MRQAVCVIMVFAFTCGVVAARDNGNAGQQGEAPVAVAKATAAEIVWEPAVDYATARLTVTGPGDFFVTRSVAKGGVIAFATLDDEGHTLPDGSYGYELQLVPAASSGASKDLSPAAASRRSAEGNQPSLQKESGRIIISGGVVSKVVPRSESSRIDEIPSPAESPAAAGDRPDTAGASGLASRPAPTDGVSAKAYNATNWYVSGLVGIGTDTPGFPIEVEKAAPLIALTSTTNSYRWHLDGFDSELYVYDSSTGNHPLTMERGLPGDSLYMAQNGAIGIGTSTPSSNSTLTLTPTANDYSSLISFENFNTNAGSPYWVYQNGTGYFGIQNGYNGNVAFVIYKDAGLHLLSLVGNNVGIGTVVPTARLHVIPDVAGSVVALFQNGTHAIQRTDGGYANIRFATAGGAVTQSWLFQNSPTNGEFVIRNETSSRNPLRVMVGAPTNSIVMTGNGVGIGTASPAGRLDVNGPIYQRGGILHSDYVFESEFELPSIEEHASLMWSNGHLPSVPARQVDEAGREFVDIGAQRRGMLEELEVAHIYIQQLEERLAQQEERLNKLEALLAQHE